MSIAIDTTNLPISIIYDRGWENSAESPVRIPERDLLELGYKNTTIVMRPFPKTLEINGDTSEAALALALLMQYTGHVLDDDIIDEAFTFVDGLIVKYNWPSNKQIEFFIKEYNRLYPTVLLLK